MSADSLIAWGVPPRTARNLVKYREHGGSFRKEADVLRIYGMDSVVIARVRSCLRFPPMESKKRLTKLCINSATPQEWESLYGIGPVLAERIVRFRAGLGGFLTVDQVADTYGLPPETFEGIRSRLTIRQTHRQLSVNDATPDELASHPYLSFREARAISNYVKQHGQLDSKDALYGIHALTPDRINDIAPYLRFETQSVAVSDE